MSITEEVMNMIEHGYTDEQIVQITGWELKWIENAREVMKVV